jgi:hypothetical protein
MIRIKLNKTHMRIVVDDWMFRSQPDNGSVVTVDLFLDNGQRALLEVHPLANPNSPGEQIPEVVVKAELPGELPDQPEGVCRWIARAPHRFCEWSKVELSETLIRQINERLSFSI